MPNKLQHYIPLYVLLLLSVLAFASPRDSVYHEMAYKDTTYKKYVVQAGDNLFRIALNHNVTVDEVLFVNGMGKGSSNIYAGQTIKVPVFGELTMVQKVIEVPDKQGKTAVVDPDIAEKVDESTYELAGAMENIPDENQEPEATLVNPIDTVTTSPVAETETAYTWSVPDSVDTTPVEHEIVQVVSTFDEEQAITEQVDTAASDEPQPSLTITAEIATDFNREDTIDMLRDDLALMEQDLEEMKAEKPPTEGVVFDDVLVNMEWAKEQSKQQQELQARIDSGYLWLSDLEASLEEEEIVVEVPTATEDQDVVVKNTKPDKPSDINPSVSEEEAAFFTKPKEEEPKKGKSKKTEEADLPSDEYEFLFGDSASYAFFKNVLLQEVDVIDKKSKKVKFGEETDTIGKMKGEFYLARALKEIDDGDYKGAHKQIKKSLKYNPSYIEAYMVRGDLYASSGYFKDAIENYSNAIVLDSLLPQAFYNRGFCYMRQDELDDAYSDYQQAINLDDQYLLAYAGLASVKISLKEYYGAIADYEKILEMNQYFAPAFKGRGVAKQKIGDYKGSIEDFNNYLEIEPYDAYVYYERGMSKVKLNKLYDACFDFFNASELGYPEAENAMKDYCD